MYALGVTKKYHTYPESIRRERRESSGGSGSVFSTVASGRFAKDVLARNRPIGAAVFGWLAGCEGDPAGVPVGRGDG